MRRRMTAWTMGTRQAGLAMVRIALWVRRLFLARVFRRALLRPAVFRPAVFRPTEFLPGRLFPRLEKRRKRRAALVKAPALALAADSERLRDLMRQWRRDDGESSTRPEGRSAAARRPRACPTESGRKGRVRAGLGFPQDIGGEKLSRGDARRAGLRDP